MVYIIGVLTDEKTQKSLKSGMIANFRPLLDVYFDEHFTSTTAYVHFAICLRLYLADAVQYHNNVGQVRRGCVCVCVCVCVCLCVMG